MFKKLKNIKGLTIIEIMVVIFIIGIVMTLVVSRSGINEGRKMRQSANHLASTIRYLYNKSATEGKFIRLVINIEEKNYWAESSSEQVMLMTEEEKILEEKNKNLSEKNIEEETVAENAGGAGGTGSALTSGFAKEENFIFKTKKLPEGVFFKDVYVEHLKNPVDAGQVEIYFFPNGYAESAIINLRNENDDEYIAIETEPLNGQVKIFDEYKKPEGL